MAKLEYLLKKEQAAEEKKRSKTTKSNIKSWKLLPRLTPEEKTDKNKKACLNYKITENGGNLVFGEKQLLCIWYDLRLK